MHLASPAIARIGFAPHPAAPLHTTHQRADGAGIGIAAATDLLLADRVALRQQAEHHELVRGDAEPLAQLGIGAPVERLVRPPQANAERFCECRGHLARA